MLFYYKINLKFFNNYQKENVFDIHKGGNTNVMLINRPISQYGLNFNSHIEETFVK